MGEFFALLSAISFSAANIMIRKGTTRSSQNNGAFLSILLTALISGIIVAAMVLSKGWPILTLEGIFWFLLAGVLTSLLGRTLLYSSIQHLGSVRATAIKRLNPFFAVLFGVLLLGDPLSSPLVIGMLFIFYSFGMLILEAYRSSTEEDNTETAFKEKKIQSIQQFKKQVFEVMKSVANLGYIYGPVSALCYGIGYIVRKQGLMEMPDPYLGTMLGASVGAFIFVIMACFQARYRLTVKSTFTSFHPWLFFAGFATSVGQIFYFIALNNIEVSRVALIASIEVILTILISAFLFKTQERITRRVIIASLISMIGAAIIAIG
jgi:drug/metabolite transporter (DMT)-like permease